MIKYHVRYDYLHYGNVVMEGERIIAVVPDFRDAEYWANALNKETAPLHETIATMQAALAEQSTVIAKQRQELVAADELLRTQGATLARYKGAMEEARQALSNQTHGGAQYQPDVLEADSILHNALQETESASTEAQSSACEWCNNGRLAGHDCDMCDGTGLKQSE